MKYKIYEKDINYLNTDCLVIFTNNVSFNRFDYSWLNEDVKKYIKSAFKNKLFFGKYKESFFSHIIDGNIKNILLLGAGEDKKLYKNRFFYLMKSLTDFIKQKQFEKISISINHLQNIYENEPTLEKTYLYEEIVKYIENSLYSFEYYKKNKNSFNKTKEINFLIEDKKDIEIIEKHIKIAQTISGGVNFTRDLGNQPPNICNPTYLEKISKEICNKHKNLSIEIIEKNEMEKLNMGAFLAVASGSSNPPKMIVINYKNNNAVNKKPIIFVGKGITFDTGGHSLKPSNSMVGMKYDMCGAASVLGVTKIVSELNLPINFIGVLACAENMPGADAARPDDIVKTHEGISVEILNTDAEGRLVLCDALSYIKKYDPEIIIDIATLTGACVVALGKEHSGLFSNNQNLAKALIHAGNYSNDKCWQLPISKEYSKQLKSNFADIANIGGEAGSITAACFLYQFVKDNKWAHLDVAGTAGTFSGNNKQATGRPVPLLIRYLMNRVKQTK